MLKVKIYLICLWFGLTLTILFFYPLFATLHDNILLLQWQTKHNVELLSVVGVSTLIISILLWLTYSISNVQVRFSLFFLFSIVPLTSFFIHFLQQLNYKNELIVVGEVADKNPLLIWVIALSVGTIFLFLNIRYPRQITYGLIMFMLSLSVINFSAGWTLMRLWRSNIPTTVITSVAHKVEPNAVRRNIVVILFDELSYEYLYKDGQINPRYTNFLRLSSKSDNYHSASSPGNSTMMAIPAILMSRNYNKVVMKYDKMYEVTKNGEEKKLLVERNNLFAVAKKKGYKTFLYGTYLPYCQLFNDYLDHGRSFSIYNYANVETQFSMLNPIMTNLIIWPRQRPQGMLKNMAISIWQRKQTSEVAKMTTMRFTEKHPFFMFSHFYCTHVPFVFNRQGYYENTDPFIESSENYVKALEYTDSLLGRLIDKMEINHIFDSSKIIILSDHNFRSMFPGKEKHIPLIVKNPYQHRKKDILDPARSENVLKEAVQF